MHIYIRFFACRFENRLILKKRALAKTVKRVPHVGHGTFTVSRDGSHFGGRRRNYAGGCAIPVLQRNGTPLRNAKYMGSFTSVTSTTTTWTAGGDEADGEVLQSAASVGLVSAAAIPAATVK